MTASEYRFQSRHRDRLIRRLELPDDGRPTRLESACIAGACFGLVLLTLWAAMP